MLWSQLHVAVPFHVFRQRGHQRLQALAADALGDLGNDGADKLLVGIGDPVGAIYILPASALSAADALDGLVDGVAGLGSTTAQPGAWKIVGSWFGSMGRSASPVSGGAHLLLGQPGNRWVGAPGQAHLIDAAALATLDARDGDLDGVIDLDDAGSFSGEPPTISPGAPWPQPTSTATASPPPSSVRPVTA